MSVNSPVLDAQQQIEKLERRHLDSYQAPAAPIWGQLDSTQFTRVHTLTSFWKEDESIRFEQYMEDLVTAFYGQQVAWAFLITSTANEIGVHLGVQGATLGPNIGETLLRTSLQGSFPGIVLEQPIDPKIGSYLNRARMLECLGRMTGIPTLKSAPMAERSTEGTVQQIERLVRALRGEEWGYFVFARPVEDAYVVQLSQRGLEQIKTYSALLKKNVQTAPGVQEERTDRQAQYCVELMEKNLERLNLGKAQGMWQTEVYYFAPRPLTLDKIRVLLRAIYAGKDSLPDPVRTFKCTAGGTGSHSDALITLLNSRELATLTQLPKEEMPGYSIKEYARFDVALEEMGISSTPDQIIKVGKIEDNGSPTGNWYAFSRSDLAKHGLVVGVTGSGKTNTVFYLLNQIWNNGKGQPFLVVEPAKAEYRDLRTAVGFDSLRVYTLGDERVAPFRLNPFEFEITDDENRIHVQTHIDYLKSVFNASFVLYAPMPYVLEQCLHEIYQDKGWDLTTSRNRRVPANPPGQEQKWNVFPTLTDLYHKIDDVTDRLGYEERIRMDVKAGLKARVESLRLGGKGLMLDTPRSLAIRELLACPTVLELERVGDDEEKAFLMGLLFTRIYEFRMLQAKSKAVLPAIQHITVIEEAHRLLKNVPTEVSTEAANVKGKAVETFANMLSEIRAYGEGVLIAEQIPAKLAPDAIKNTNLKILHRVVAEDDRQIVGATMNLEEQQLRAVSTFRCGQAAVYAEGNDHPFLVEVYAFKGNAIKGHLRDDDLRVAMAAICQRSRFDSRTRDDALAVMRHLEFRERFARYIHSLLAEPKTTVQAYADLKRLIGQSVRVKTVDEERRVAQCVFTEAIAYWFEEKGRQYNWFYNATDSARQQLEQIALQVAAGFENQAEAMAKLAAAIEPAAFKFQQSYRDLCSKAPVPFEGCYVCQSRCLYRYDVVPFVQDVSLHREFVSTIQNAKSDDVMWSQLAACACQVGDRLIATNDPKDASGPAICYVAQMGPFLHFNRATQRKLVKNIHTVISASKSRALS